MGHVSILTDAFAFGIVMLELLSNLTGSGARAILQIELAEVNYESLRKQHDIQGRNWPDGQLRQLADIILKCTQEKPAKRCNIADIAPLLEAA